MPEKGRPKVKLQIVIRAEVRDALDNIALYLKSNDVQEMIRGWVNEKIRSIEEDPKYQEFVKVLES